MVENDGIDFGAVRSGVGEVVLFKLSIFVGFSPCICWDICPSAVSRDFGRCFFTAVLVIPGHVLKKALTMASVHIDTVGHNTHL